jgi:asparagine synthase (glutamine-hydrolysing)
MCGICGFINYKGKNNHEVLNNMTDVLIHRGPDDSGTTLLDDGAVGLGHRRLSIIDLTERGRQPMTNEDGTIWLTYNGEIYNFKDIRKTLESKGHRFMSNTDTEVIIHAYEEWGIECIKRFSGMFSFGLWDSKAKTLFLVRDRLGIKPLYYTFIDGAIAFASEIKSLLMIPGINKEIDFQNISNYLMFLWAPKDITPFKNIFKLAPAEYLIYKDNNAKKVKYWDVEFGSSSSDENSCSARILEALTASVKDRLISDVPLGAFLSGGVDSSLILALMRKIGKKNIITYTVGFGAEQLKHDICPDDVYYSRIARDSIGGLDYNEIILEADVSNLWSKIGILMSL